MACISSISRVISLAFIFYFIHALLFATLNQVIVAGSEPVEMDNGNGTFNATWDFDNPLNYSANNITISNGMVNLTLGKYWWNQTSQSDFSNGIFVNTKAIPAGELILKSEMGNTNLIRTGDFSSDQNWTFVSDENITSMHNTTGENAELGYTNFTLPKIANLIPEVGEDDGFVIHEPLFAWWDLNNTDPSTEIGYYYDGTDTNRRAFFYFNLSSIPPSATITNVSFYADIQSNSVNDTHRIDIHALDLARTAHIAQTLYDDCGNGTLYVDDDTSLNNSGFTGYHEWNLGAQAINDVQDNLSREWFGIGIREEGDDDERAFLGSFESANPPQLNVTYINPVPITFNETAYVNQTFLKPNVTPNSPEAVNLSFNYSVEKLLSLSANLTVEIDGITIWNDTIMAVTPLTSIYVDVGQYMNESKEYNISFQLHMDVNGATNIDCAVKFDDVNITALDFSWAGNYTSEIFDAGSEVFWDEIGWNVSAPLETAYTIRTTTSPDNASWGEWSTEYSIATGEQITPQMDRYIRYTVNLSRTNYTKNPVLSDVNISYKKYNRNGTIETEDFIPSKVVRWSVFNSTFFSPTNTNITYWYSTDSGNSWYQIYPGDDLRTVPTPKIRFRMNLSTLDPTKTPTLYEINLTYITDDMKPLVIVNKAAYGPFSSDPGSIIDIDFDYGGIGNTTLDFAQYKVGVAGIWHDVFSTDIDIFTANWSVLWSDLAEGTNIIYIRCNDTAGNSNDTESVTILKDTVKPEVIVNIASYGPYNSNPGSIIDVDFSSLGGTDLDYAEWDTDPVFGSPTMIFVVDTPTFTTDWGVIWSEMVEGSNTIYIRCYDLTGNCNDTETVMFFKDTVEPGVLVNTAFYGPYNSDPGSIIDVDFSSLGGTDLDYAEWDTDPGFGSPTTIFTVDTPSYNTDWGVTWSELVEGSNTIYIRCNDTAGNSNDTESITILKDTVKPEVIVNIASYGPYNSNPGNVIDVDFNNMGGSNLDYAEWDTDPGFGSPTTIFTADIPSYDANWSVTWAELIEGSNTIYIRCCDVGGNINDSQYVIIVWGNILPEAPTLVEPYNGKIVLTSTPTFVWTEPSDANGDEIVLYQIQISEFLNFSTLAENEFPTELFFQPSSPLSDSMNYYWQVRAFDGLDWGNFSEAKTFTVNTTYYHPRIIAPVPDQVKPEDFGFWVLEDDLQDFAEDVDTPASELEWYITGENTSLYIIYNEYTTTLSILTIENKFGSDEVMLWVRDKDNNTDYQTLWINITPVNDEPTIESIDPLIVHYDAPYRYNFYNYVDDIETPKERLVLETSDPQYTEVGGLWITFNYPKEMLGDTRYMSVSVFDEEGASSSTLVSVIISEDWVPELVKNLPDISLYEGESIFNVFDLDEYFTDPDGDSLYYAIGYSHVSITINENNTVDVVSPPNWYGKETVTFIALDPLGARVEDIVTITVHPINDPPIIANVPDLVVHYDELYSFNLEPYISDPDTEMEDLILSTDKENVTFDGLVMKVNFSKSLEGKVVAVVIVVSDGMGSDWDAIGILVLDDHPPKSLVEKLPPVWFYEDTTYTPLFSLHDFFVDDDPEDTLYYTNATGGIKVSIDQISGRMTFTPYANWSGVIKLTVRAIDPHGAIAESDMTITVMPVNDPPVISPIPDQENPIGTHWILDLKEYISDVDNDDEGFTDLIVTVNNLHPEGVSLIGSVLIFDYPEGVRFDNVTITVNDGDNEVSCSFSVRLIKPSTPGFWDIIDWRWLMALIFFSSFLIVGGVFKFRNRNKIIIEEAFLVTKSGMLIKHATRRLQPNIDDDLLAGMLTAVQAFIYDSFDYSEDKLLRGMEFGENRVIIERGKISYLAIFYSGEMTESAKKHIKKWMEDFEDKYGDALYNWDGDLDVFKNLDEMTIDLFEINQWRKPGKQSILSADNTSEGIDVPFESDLTLGNEIEAELENETQPSDKKMDESDYPSP